MWGSSARGSREPPSPRHPLCVGLVLYLERVCFLEGQPQKPSGPLGHRPRLGHVGQLDWLAGCCEGVSENLPSCRAGTISSRATKDSLEGSGRSAPQSPRPPSAKQRVLSDPAFPPPHPHPFPPRPARRSLVWRGSASPNTFSPLPTPGRVQTLGAALRAAATLAPRPSPPAPRGFPGT